MSRIYSWYNGLSKQIRDSITISIAIVGLISTVLSILGISLGDFRSLSLLVRIVIVIVIFLIVCWIIYIILGKLFGESVDFIIRQTAVSIASGDIFDAPGLRIIGCDTHFDTRIDDIVITKNSLHGQLFLKHGNIEEIILAVESEARRLGLKQNSEGMYDFPLGTIIRYDSSVDKNTYLMLAMTELNKDYEARTNMVTFEQMLMKMWKEINRVYASYDVYLPLLGTGIARFDDGPKEDEMLLRCMLCTLNSSGVSFNSKVSVLIYGNDKDIPLYEYKDLFRTIIRR